MREIVLCAQIIGIFALLVDLIYVSFQKPSSAQNHLVILTSSVIIMLIGYLMEIIATDQNTAMAGTVFAYVGKPYALMATYLFVADFCGKQFSRKWVLFHAAINSIYPALIITNSYHHLYYSSVDFDPTRRFSGLILGHGPFYYLYMAMIIFNFVACLYFTIKEFRAVHSKEVRIQCLYLAGMLSSTVIGYLIFLTGFTGGYDTTMAGTFVGAILLTILFFRYKLFDSLSLAKDKAMDESGTGYLVVKDSGEVDYLNSSASRILSDALSLESLNTLHDGDHVLNGRDGLVYEIMKSHVIQKDRVYGETMEIREITEKHNYSLRLESEVNERTREIKRIQRTIISAFAGIIDARDNSTGTHIRNMSRYAEIIARSLHESGDDNGILSEEMITIIVDVAPLHDIGKLSIPDSILLKPGKLTDEEYELMKTHAVQGGKIIRECLDGVESEVYVKMAENVALYHHERWDGKGYPMGLAGTDIPLSARIMSVADVYDAVRSERVYKPPFDLYECRRIIEEGSGTQFDPTVVRAFMRAIDQIESLSD